MAIYMQFEGITGNVTAKGHEKWIELGSAQVGVGRGIGAPTGRDSNRESSQPSISELVVTHSMDETSPLLFQEACVGKGKKVTVHFVRTSAEQLETYYEITLTNALVSGWSMSSGGDRPTESISLNFTKIETKYTPYDKSHNKGTPVPAAYDLATATKG
jgi:type VI secretion system secreted protein Hcp